MITGWGVTLSVSFMRTVSEVTQPSFAKVEMIVALSLIPLLFTFLVVQETYCIYPWQVRVVRGQSVMISCSC